MSKDLGEKHTCSQCDVRFYDLRRTPPKCPKCGEIAVIATPSPPPRAIAAAPPLRPVPKTSVADPSQRSAAKEEHALSGGVRAEDIPEVDEDEDDASEVVTLPDREMVDYGDDDADDETILETLGEENPDMSIVTTIAEAEAAERQRT